MRLDTRVTGAAVGASVVYLLDRDHGHDRRARLGSGLTSLFTPGSERLRLGPGARLEKVRARVRERQLWFQRTVRTRQDAWDLPLTTVTINVDDTVTLRDMFRAPQAERLPLRPTPAHRGFTRSLQRVRHLTPSGGLRSG